LARTHYARSVPSSVIGCSLILVNWLPGSWLLRRLRYWLRVVGSGTWVPRFDPVGDSERTGTVRSGHVGPGRSVVRLRFPVHSDTVSSVSMDQFWTVLNAVFPLLFYFNALIPHVQFAFALDHWLPLYCGSGPVGSSWVYHGRDGGGTFHHSVDNSGSAAVQLPHVLQRSSQFGSFHVLRIQLVRQHGIQFSSGILIQWYILRFARLRAVQFLVDADCSVGGSIGRSGSVRTTAQRITSSWDLDATWLVPLIIPSSSYIPS